MLSLLLLLPPLGGQMLRGDVLDLLQPEITASLAVEF